MIAPYLLSAETAATPEERAARFTALVRSFAAYAGTDRELQLRVLRLADLALAQELSYADRLDVRFYKITAIDLAFRAHAIQSQNRTAGLAEARRDASEEILRSLSDVSAEATSFHTRHPDFDLADPPKKPVFKPKIKVFDPDAWPPGEAPPLTMGYPRSFYDAFDAWEAVDSEGETLRNAQKSVDTMKVVLASLHALPPFDYDWLGSEARRVLGIEAGEALMAEVREGLLSYVAYRTRIEVGDLDALSLNDLAALLGQEERSAPPPSPRVASPARPRATPAASPADPATSTVPSKRPGFWMRLGLPLTALAAVCLGVWGAGRLRRTS